MVPRWFANTICCYWNCTYMLCYILLMFSRLNCKGSALYYKYIIACFMTGNKHIHCASNVQIGEINTFIHINYFLDSFSHYNRSYQSMLKVFPQFSRDWFWASSRVCLVQNLTQQSSEKNLSPRSKWSGYSHVFCSFWDFMAINKVNCFFFRNWMLMAL